MYSNYCLFFVSIVSTKLTIDANDNTTNWVMKMNQKKMFENRIEQTKSVVLKINSKYDNVKKMTCVLTCVVWLLLQQFFVFWTDTSVRHVLKYFLPPIRLSLIEKSVKRKTVVYRRSSEGRCWLRCYNQGR